jgi:hypothetical protein
MNTTTLTSSPAAIRDDTTLAWTKHAQFNGYRDTAITTWDTTTTPDGQPMLSGRVGGSEAVRQLRSFADKTLLVLEQPGDLRPVMDVSEPERVAVVWRTGGVWVTLWAPEPAETAVRPVPDPVRVETSAARFCGFFGPTAA